ncbi:MAG: hypothetical protein MUF21_07970 [Gemmatimonadaceae bacterium]|nr:hypothetical protein [Gemmatimonadaceae bacterium]
MTIRSPRRNIRRHAASTAPLLAAAFLVQATAPAAATAQSGPATATAAATALSFRDVIGRPLGARVTVHAEAMRYLERLGSASPRVRLLRMGESWERRALVAAAISDPANIARLDAIQATSRQLASPTTEALLREARAAIPGQPAVVWLGGSIHGFELSGTEGALKLVEHLVTRSDPATLEVLRKLVVIVDPMLNPDGRDMFATSHHDLTGETASALPFDWSHDWSPWQALAFRTGHYHFDTNRDWFAQTQRETRERMPTLHAWRPQVVIDMHEQDVDGEFYFDPPGEPVNPSFPAFASRWQGIFGARYAAAFDSAGFEYMTRERYNYFYPGYTESFGFHGAVAMLFEQGSTRGLRLERGDRTVRTLAQALEQQYVAAWTALRTVADRHDAFLGEYLDSQRQVVTAGDGGMTFVLPIDPQRPGVLRELVETLERNAIVVDSAPRGVRVANARDRTGVAVGAREIAGPAYVIRTTQQAGRLARTLLEPTVPMNEGFLARAREFTDRAENPRFYDVTAWSLPLLFDVAAFSTAGAVTGETVPRSRTDARATVPRATYAYLLDGSQPGSLAALWHLRDRGHRAGVLTTASRIAGRAIGSGAVIARVGQNDRSLHDVIDSLAARYALRITPVGTGLADSGYASLGSGDHSVNVRPAAIGILAEDGINGYSFGFAWYTLDAQYGIPVTVLRTRSIGALAQLARLDVIVVPDAQPAALAAALGEAGVRRLEQWVRDGGTLVTIGGGGDWARAQFRLALRSWYDTEAGKGKAAIAVPGAIYGARLDTRHWLTSGATSTLPVLLNGTRLWLPPSDAPSPQRHVLATIADSVPLSGHAWSETRQRIRGSVFLYEERVGAGRVIAFADDPNFRGVWRGANRLFLNAVVLAPSGRGP